MNRIASILTALTLAATSLAAQAGTYRLEVDAYGAQGPDSYAAGLPWEWKGIRDTFTAEDGNFALSRPYASNSDYVNSLSISFRTNTAYAGQRRWIDLDFSTDKIGVPLAVGVYEGAQRFPFNTVGHPGLDMSDSGGGFNTLDGRFQIYDIQFNAQGGITAFAASFEIYNYPAPSNSPLVGGRIWFNSDVAIPAVPEPQTWMTLALGLAALSLVSKRRG